MQTHTLLSTTHPFDANLLGYDGPCNPNEDSEGLIVTTDDSVRMSNVTLVGPDGEVCILGHAAISETIKALQACLRSAVS